jgi:hypothetical protein
VFAFLNDPGDLEKKKTIPTPLGIADCSVAKDVC